MPLEHSNPPPPCCARYPNKYESVIADLCENLENLDEPEAKASMVWIIGEYADRIDNANDLLEQFVENFATENTMVFLSLSLFFLLPLVQFLFCFVCFFLSSKSVFRYDARVRLVMIDPQTPAHEDWGSADRADRSPSPASCICSYRSYRHGTWDG
jgi:hypothetical protein